MAMYRRIEVCRVQGERLLPQTASYTSPQYNRTTGLEASRVDGDGDVVRMKVDMSDIHGDIGDRRDTEHAGLNIARISLSTYA